jgi:hypothetical protein
MISAYKSLVRYALKNNCTVSVWDGAEYLVRFSKSYRDIDDAIKQVYEASIFIFRDDKKIGAALIIPNLCPDETVADHSCSEFIEEWEAESGIYA